MGKFAHPELSNLMNVVIGSPLKFLKPILLFLSLTACALPAGQITSTSTALQQESFTITPSLTSLPTITNTLVNTPTITKTTIPTFTLFPTTPPTPTPTPEPLEIIRFMQYNIEFGAGAHFECREYFRPSGKNTLDDVIEIVGAANPHILAANETCFWNWSDNKDWGNYTKGQIIKDYFAVRAGFNTCFVGENYFAGTLPDAACVKPGFKLLETESLKFSDGKTNGDNFSGIRIKVLTPNNYEIVIFNSHFMAGIGEPSRDARIKGRQVQAQWIADKVSQEYIQGNQRVIVTGDFNLIYEYVKTIFSEANLRPLDYENNEMMWDEFEEDWNKYGYTSPGDQIWISSGLEFGLQEGQFDELKALIPEISTWEPSDHPPLPAIIYVMPLTYQPSIATPVPTIPPTQTATVHPLTNIPLPSLQQVNADGFGISENGGVLALEVFLGNLYAGGFNTDDNGNRRSQVWRYDGNNWEAVNTDGFENSLNVAVEDFLVFGNYIYAAIWSQCDEESGKGAEIWRSLDGTNWELVISSGFGLIGEFCEITRLFDFQGYIYAVSASENGLEIWRSQTGGSDDWEKVVEGGFGNPENLGIQASAVLNDKLFVGTFTLQGTAQIYTTQDGLTWTLVNDFNSDEIQNRRVTSLDIFNDRMYATVVEAGKRDEILARVYRCIVCDGTDWELVFDGPYKHPGTYYKPALEVYENNLYLVVGNVTVEGDGWYPKGVEIWRTLDGVEWEQIAVDGINDQNNRYTYFDNGMTIFNGSLYVGFGNYATGSEVWVIKQE